MEKWNICFLVVLLCSLPKTNADNCNDPNLGQTVVIDCSDTSTGEFCTVQCKDGHALVGPENITCTCNKPYETTQTPKKTYPETTSTITSGPYETTQIPPKTYPQTTRTMTSEPYETTETPTKTYPDTTRAMTSGGPLVTCSWDYTEDGGDTICALSTTLAATTTQSASTKLVTWQQYWISTGILIFFVCLLLVATSFLLWQHWRRAPIPSLKAEPNNYTRQNPSTRTPMFIEESNYDQASQQSSQPPIRIPLQTANTLPPPAPGPRAFDSQRPHTIANPRVEVTTTTIPSSNHNESRHSKPVPLPKPDPSTLPRGPVRGPGQAPQFRLSTINPTTPPSAPPLRSRSPTVDSSDGYDNDPPVPELPPPNPPPRQPQQPIYTNKIDEDPYYEEARINIGDENGDDLYNDIEV